MPAPATQAQATEAQATEAAAGGEPAVHTRPLTIPDDGELPRGARGDKVAKPSIDRGDRTDKLDRNRPKPEPRDEKKRPELDVEATYKTGQGEFLRGDAKAALATFRKLTEAKPGFAPAWRGSALALERLGQKAAAARALRRYLKLAPNAGDAAQIKARLERLE